tara:strand:- start:362 stop:538 length:177 start_codon:yes stop_codon:yes gene_type:complete
MPGGYDWRKYPSRWMYSSLRDPRYIEDRDNLFREHGNGWWQLTPYRKACQKSKRKSRT